MALPTWGPPHLGGGVFEGKPANMIPDTCMAEAMNVEFSELAPRTRRDFTVEEASGPGTPPYAAVARFETATGTVYRVMVDSLGDIYAQDEAGGSWTQVNLFAGKGQINTLVLKAVQLHNIGSVPALPYKWGYGVGIMAQAGDGFSRLDGSAHQAIATSGDDSITLVDNWAGGGTSAFYTIRRRLTIQADKEVVLYPFKNILWISDQVGRPYFWDGTTFGEVACFLDPRDDTAAITELAGGGGLPAGVYRYRLVFISASGAFCPPSPEMLLGSEYFSFTLGAPGKIFLTLKIYAQGFPSWVTKVAVYRTKVDPAGQTPFVCTRPFDDYLKCEWSQNMPGFFATLAMKAMGVQPCRNAGECPNKRAAPAVPFFYVDTFDLDGTNIGEETLDAVIEQNELWLEYGVRKHPPDADPANWTELPTYINAVEWLTDYAARLFCVSGDEPDEVRFSGRPTAFSETGGADEPGWWFRQNARVAGRDDAQNIRAGFELGGRFYVAKDSAIFALDTQRSADPMNWALVPSADNAGAASGRSVLTTTKHAFLLGYVQGQARMFAFDGFYAKDISDAIRTTLDSLDVQTAEGRALIDSVAWETYLIFSAAPSPAAPGRTQLVVDRRTGAWTIWDAKIRRFSKGVPHPSKLLCVKVEDVGVHSFLKGWGAITSYVVTKAYEITKAHVWKTFGGFWADMYSETGLEQVDDVADLAIAVYTGGEAWYMVPQKDGTILPEDKQKQLWRNMPLKTSGDWAQLKFEVNSIAKDFSLRRLIHEYDPKVGRRTKQ